jgi:hypothetical protein
MGTVLWANVRVDGPVVSDQQDRRAPYRHADTLDRIWGRRDGRRRFRTNGRTHS